MEEQFKFTKSQLIEAFRKWDKDYQENPNDFVSLNEADAEEQANTLIDYLNKE